MRYSYNQARLTRAYRHILLAQKRGAHARYCMTMLRTPLLAATAARQAAHQAGLAFLNLNAIERKILLASI